MKNVSIVLLCVLVSSALVGGVVLSQLIFSKPIASSMTLVSDYFQVYNEDKLVIISSLSFNEMLRGMSVSETVNLKNISPETIDAAWSATALPSGVEMTVEYVQGGVAYPWNPNDYGVDMIPPNGYMAVIITLTNVSGVEGVYPFTITFMGTT